MKWEETEADKCRYGEIASRIFGEAEIIWERSEAGYQGSANVLAAMPDGTFVHYEWTYGSCSGCDEWEARGLSDDEVEQEMRSAMAVLKDVETLRKYLHLTEGFEDAEAPSANTPTNGGIVGPLRALCGTDGTEFQAMACAAQEWLAKREVGDAAQG